MKAYFLLFLLAFSSCEGNRKKNQELLAQSQRTRFSHLLSPEKVLVHEKKNYELNWIDSGSNISPSCEIFKLVFENDSLIERLYFQRSYLTEILIYNASDIVVNCPDAVFRNAKIHFLSSNALIDSLMITEYRGKNAVRLDVTKDTLYIKNYGITTNLDGSFLELELRQRSGGDLIKIQFDTVEHQLVIKELIMGKR